MDEVSSGFKFPVSLRKIVMMIAQVIPITKNNSECCNNELLSKLAVNFEPYSEENSGAKSVVTPNVKKLIAPVALPFTLSGFTSLMME